MTKKLTLIFLLSILSTILLYAKPSDEVILYDSEMSAVEKDFFDRVDKKDRNLSIDDLFDGYLIASSVTNQSDFNRNKAQLNKIRSDVKAYMRSIKNQSEYERARALLFWLYDNNVFRTYNEKATLASQVLDTGTYNCTSSSTLYTLLATESGFDSRVEFTKQGGHTFSKISTDQGEIDVETTNKYGFDPGVKYFDGEYYHTTDRTHYPDRRTLSLNEMIAYLYENTDALLPHMNVFNITAFKKAHYIYPNSQHFRINIVHVLANGIFNNINSGNYAEAKNLLTQALMFDPNNVYVIEARDYYDRKVGDR